MRKSVLIIFLMLPVTVFMLSCHVGTSGSWKNDHIDAVERNKIATLNDRLFKAITTDDIEGVKKLMFSGLVSILGKKTDTIVIQCLMNTIQKTQLLILQIIYFRLTATLTITLYNTRH
jgi:hypothetical protein